jgi:surface antigen
MHNRTKFHSRHGRVALLLAGALALAGCDAWNRAWKLDDSNDLGEQIMQKHYLNGDMNAQQYNSEVKVFNPAAKAPGTTDAGQTNGLDAAFPGASDSTVVAPPKSASP